MRIGIIDDGEIRARTLAGLLDREPGLTAVAVLEGPERFPDLVAAAPELVFLASGGERVLELLAALRDALPDAAVVVLADSGDATAEATTEALRAAGARACFARDRFLPLVRRLAAEGMDGLLCAGDLAGPGAPG